MFLYLHMCLLKLLLLLLVKLIVAVLVAMEVVVCSALNNLFLVLCCYYRKIGPRSHVWSEKEFIDQAVYEFAEVTFQSIQYLIHDKWL